ncbi:DASH family cryptochrome [Chitinibacter fontanus]|uniref:Cryptochrome DASH n=1 Tax=Chitinibacter fontanus TaxID=1737446 RepID=A0A7D5V8A8_9NEIS|nr:DASH family cryptochrome [Chitinibacter fontanus]QLI80595.1 DASH family cryptochrome [Chitinibacter fontanus]
MRTAIYWFRNDLRLADNPALQQACAQAEQLALVYCLPPDENTAWGFVRVDQHRKAFLADTLQDLAAQCQQLGQQLLIIYGKPEQVLPALMQSLAAEAIYCEAIFAPEEIAQCQALRAQNCLLHTVWQSSMLDPARLPFAPEQLPLVFTTFRQQIEAAAITPPAPLAAPSALPPAPAQIHDYPAPDWLALRGEPVVDARSAFPYASAAWRGGASCGLAHLQRYFASGLADQYKQTRNGLIGTDYSCKFSPWLATGAISARQILQTLREHEAQVGANDSSYWIWFELLWRDYFRLLHWRFGAQLYRAGGLKGRLEQPHHPEQFVRWCQADTGQPFIDAAMRELAATGYLSNRMRQNVASYLIHDLQCDWRAGAAWFEAQLLDYDVYSNQGNWLYLAGLGTDPRPNRRFNTDKQAKMYDPDQGYIKLWLDN